MSAPSDSKQVVALRYDAEASGAPKVVASGRGAAAEAILTSANEHGVPVQEDAALLGLLAGCEVGEEIPAELYEAVAELLTWIYQVEGRLLDT